MTKIFVKFIKTSKWGHHLSKIHQMFIFIYFYWILNFFNIFMFLPAKHPFLSAKTATKPLYLIFQVSYLLYLNYNLSLHHYRQASKRNKFIWLCNNNNSLSNALISFITQQIKIKIFLISNINSHNLLRYYKSHCLEIGLILIQYIEWVYASKFPFFII